jgi:hypothetical protein
MFKKSKSKFKNKNTMANNSFTEKQEDYEHKYVTSNGTTVITKGTGSSASTTIISPFAGGGGGSGRITTDSTTIAGGYSDTIGTIGTPGSYGTGGTLGTYRWELDLENSLRQLMSYKLLADGPESLEDMVSKLLKEVVVLYSKKKELATNEKDI